jgi:DNA repair protein RAD50
LKDWENELTMLRGLGKLAMRRDELNTIEVPALQKQLKEKESELPEATKKANEVGEQPWPYFLILISRRRQNA